MRWLVCLPLLFVPGPCKAWDTTPHRRITKAALDALPARLLNRFGKEAAPLVEIYCMYPDRYVEMASYGFVRNSPGPRTVSEILNYCVRPDGELLHGATGDRDTDLGSLQYLFERIGANSSRTGRTRRRSTPACCRISSPTASARRTPSLPNGCST